MSAKMIVYSERARERMLSGVNTLANALSAAGLMPTTEAMVTERPEKKKTPVAAEMDEDMY